MEQSHRSPHALLAALAVIAALGVTLMSLAGGSGLRTALPEPPISVPPLVEDPASTTTTTTPPPRDTWELLPAAPLAARAGQTAVWTGTEMLVWGGGLGADDVYDDGAAYRPDTAAWRALGAPPDGFGPRLWHTAVWTGTEMIVWGGYPHGADEVEGVAYDPGTGAWRPLAPAGQPHRWLHTAVWTGTEMIVWGGEAPSGSDAAARGLAYDPAADSWRPIAPAPIAARSLHTAVWTGAEMIVWGGATAGGYTADGAAYRPATDTWELLPPGPLAPRARHAAMWDGEQMVVFGGRLAPAGALTADGAAWDPSAGEWRALPFTALEPRESPILLAIDGGLLAWSGTRQPALGTPSGLRTGSVLLDLDQRWLHIRNSPFEGGGDFSAVWTGDRMLVWGHPRAGPPVGAAYRP